MLAFLGTPEIIAICVVVLLLFGAKKLPELARGMGKSLGEFKKAKKEFEDEVKSAVDDVNQDSTAVPPTPATPATPPAPQESIPYEESKQD